MVGRLAEYAIAVGHRGVWGAVNLDRRFRFLDGERVEDSGLETRFDESAQPELSAPTATAPARGNTPLTDFG